MHPEIPFLAGNMLELPLGEGKLGGIITFYSIIHFNKQQVSQAFQEMYRTLRQGGHLLLGIHVGREVTHTDELWGVPVNFDAAFFELKDLGDNLESLGFKVRETVQRDAIPEVEYQSIRGYIWARTVR